MTTTGRTAALGLAFALACGSSGAGDDGSDGDTTTTAASETSTSASAGTTASTSTTASSTGPSDETSTGGSSGGGSDSGSSTGEPALVPMFVAQGMIGRTTISCDDGNTWVANRSWDLEGDPLVCGSTDPIRCDAPSCQFFDGTQCATQSPCDCGHNPGFSKGVAYGNGWFVATWGWGFSGSVRRSKNGVDWEETLAQDVTFGGLAFGADTFVLSSRNPQYSTDGSGWMPGNEADFRGPNDEIVWSVRRFGFIDYDGGRFVATANPPESVLVTSDAGQNWWVPSAIDDTCLASVGTYGGIAAANGMIIGVGDDGVTCRSTDGGDTWTLGSVGGEGIYSRLLWTGSEFVTWAPGVRYSSPDGVTWSSTPLTPEGVWLGAVAISEATGTYAASGRVWDGYEDQSFLRSTNGIDWEYLPEGAFEGSHWIFEMAFGWGEPSDLCPL